jgi:hypothetical protein
MGSNFGDFDNDGYPDFYLEERPLPPSRKRQLIIDVACRWITRQRRFDRLNSVQFQQATLRNGLIH